MNEEERRKETRTNPETGKQEERYEGTSVWRVVE